MPAGSKNAPEARAREKIDRLLEDAGWTLQDRDDMNVSLSAVAVREFKLDKGHGYAVLPALPRRQGGWSLRGNGLALLRFEKQCTP